MKINFNIAGRRYRERAKREARREWHRRFAWLPTIVDENETTSSVVWFERYMRKEDLRIGTGRAFFNKVYWENLSAGEYMKRKLRGDFNKIKDTEADAPSSSGYGVSSALQRQTSSVLNKSVPGQ